MISDAVKTRIPNGGWKIATSKVLGLMSKLDKIMNYIPILNFPVGPVMQRQLDMMNPNYFMPQQTSY